MILLYNGKVQLQPYEVTYNQTRKKVIKEGYMDEKTHKYIKPEVEDETHEKRCGFETASDAEAYAQAVGGVVTDLTPDQDTLKALETMTFDNLEAANAFIKNGIIPPAKMTVEKLAEIIDDMAKENITKGTQK